MSRDTKDLDNIIGNTASNSLSSKLHYNGKNILYQTGVYLMAGLMLATTACGLIGKTKEETKEMVTATETVPETTVVETVTETTAPVFTIESKLNEIQSTYSLDFKKKIELIEDKVYMEALLRNDDVIKSLSNFNDLQKFDEIITKMYSIDFLNILNKSIEPLTQERKNTYIDMVLDERNQKAVCINFIANDLMPTVEVGLVNIPYKIQGIETITVSNAYEDSENSKKYDNVFFGEIGLVEKNRKFYDLLKETMNETDYSEFTKKQFLDLLKEQLQREDVGTFYFNFIADIGNSSGGIAIQAKNQKLEALDMNELVPFINKYTTGKIINIFQNSCDSDESLNQIEKNKLLSNINQYNNVLASTSSLIGMTHFSSSVLLASADPKTKFVERYNISTFDELVDFGKGLNGDVYDEDVHGKAVLYRLIEGYDCILAYEGKIDLDPHRITNTNIKDDFAPLIVLTPGKNDYFYN